MHKVSPVGLYTSDAAGEYVNYVRPQEHGNHFGVRKLTNGDLVFTGKDSFECCISQYSTDDLFKAEHTDELHADGNVHLRIDHKVSGIGSASCSPDLEKEYSLDEKKIHFAFAMCPVIQ